MFPGDERHVGFGRLGAADRASRLPAYELYASAEGFFEPSQQALTEQYLPRFFSEMPGTAARRRGWALARVIACGLPVAAASPEVLQLAEAALAGSRGAALDPAVRRSFTDGTDTLRRAVRSLQRYSRGLTSQREPAL